MLDALIMAGAIALELPVDCRPGESCFIQQYADHDPGPGAKDYRCGAMTYDGHDGTDFRLPTLAAQRQGVRVLAAAAGVVRNARDGMEDVPVDRIGVAAVKDRECGNGVVLTHPDSWETQYCHLAKGSVLVRPGQAVSAGEALGLVGESGDAAFPHLHLSVRHGAEKIDPFASGAPANACGSGAALWTQKAAQALAYRSPELINWGFADGPLSMDDIEEGRARQPGLASAAAVAFVRAIGLLQGDVLELDIAGPAGFAAKTAPVVLDHDKAQYMMFAGRKRPPEGWPKGAYRAKFIVRRGGKPVLEKAFELLL